MAEVLFEITEGSTAWVTVSFYSRLDVLEAPTAVSYEIWDITSGTCIKTATSLTPLSQVEITLSAGDNAILAQTHFREARKVIVTATYAGSEQLVKDFVYHVRNIAFRPS